MARMGRPGLSASQKAELWQRWKNGQSLSDIARVLRKHPGSIHGVVSANGGIVPRERCRSRLALSLSEREEISRGIAAGDCMRQIAFAIRRAPSTVSREVARHDGRKRYRASQADQAAWDRARRPKPCRLAAHRRLQKIVAERLGLDWSPEQISGWLKRKYPGDEEMQISHETIYRSLFVQARGVLKKELVRHLRTRRMMRRSKKASTRGQPRVDQLDENEWDQVMSVNVKGMWQSCKAVFPAMKEQQSGSIINISSLAATYGMPNGLHYTASKAAVIGLTRGLAREVGRYNIRVNAVAPNVVNTDATAEVFGDKRDKVVDVTMSQQSIRKPLQTEDIVGAVLFLASDYNKMITGQTIMVDGGTVML